MAPRLRKDLVATTADEQGVACVEVSDPGTGTSFRFYDFEYALAQELNGQPLEAVASWAQATYGIELSPETLAQFLEKLAGLGFLEGTSSGAQPAMLAPFSPSSSAHPFGDLPTTVAVDGSPVLEPAAWVPPPSGKGLATPTPRATSAQQASSALQTSAAPQATAAPQPKIDAAAPQGLISDDPREYGLRDAGSGLWERPEGVGAVAVSAAQPREPFALLPKLEVLAGPLPPVGAQAGTDSATPQLSATPATGRPLITPGGGTAVAPPPPAVTFPMASDMPKPVTPAVGLSIPVRWPPPDLSALGALGAPSPFAAPRAPARVNGGGAASVGASVGVETPLASVADAIAASITGGGTGAVADGGRAAGLDRGPATETAADGGDDEGAGAVADVGFSSLATAHLRRSERAAGEVSPPPSSWARDLADEVDRPSGALVGSGAVRAADGQRPQHPPAEVVVIPPVGGGGARPTASSSQSATATVITPRRRSYAFPVILLLVAAGSGAIWFFRAQQSPPSDEGTSTPAVSSAEAAPQLHVVSPQPTTFYGWFETAGTVTPGQDEKLGFRASGRVQELMPPGTTFAAGETIGRLFGVAERELAVNRLRSRVSYYEQLRDSSRAEGAGAALQQAEAKLAMRRLELAAAQAELTAWEIRPRVPGVIAQSFVSKGTVVKAGAPVVHVRSSGPRATFPLSADDATKARALGFCRIETVPGTGGGAGGAAEAAVRAIDCAISGGPSSTGPLAVDLVGASAVSPGTQVRLASARYDGVFPVPRAGLVREGGVDHVWVVSGGGRFAERRTVEVVGTVDDLALLGHGIAVGDAVIVDPPATLKAGAEISVAR